MTCAKPYVLTLQISKPHSPSICCMCQCQCLSILLELFVVTLTLSTQIFLVFMQFYFLFRGLHQLGLLMVQIIYILIDRCFSDRPNSLLRGLMVDWFEVLNPDVVRNHLETQLEFIFSKRQGLQNAVTSSESSVVASSSSSSPLLLSSDCRQTYMLALVINRSSWSDMRLIVRHLLSSQAIVKR